ncbi:MAG TPA: glycosyltransferase family 39 protein, partial [Candidatus Acidoferrum sp.]|nr:glycosyltransferase family 39 protein [Candidatus Acidoferrum sp.]
MRRSVGLWIKSHRALLLILLIACALRIGYLLYYHGLSEWNQLTVDNLYHHNWAISIAHGHIFGGTTYFRAPFYVYCLGLLYAVFGTSLWVGRLFGLAIGVASVAMTYFLGKRVFTLRVGLVAALLQAFCPILIYFESELLLDPLFTLLVQITLYQIITWRESQRPRELLVAGVLSGLAAITRPTILVIIPLVIVLVILQSRVLRYVLRQSALYICGALIIIGPIFIRNLIVAGDPVLIASQGGINWYIGNNASADGISATLPEPLGFNWRIKDITYVAEKERGRELRPGEVSAFWTAKADDWILSHPGDFLSLTFKKLYYILGPREISNNRDLPSFFARVPLLHYNPLGFGLILAL